MASVRVALSLACAASFAFLVLANGYLTRREGDFFRSKTADVSDKYHTLITPISWAFGIWGVIYVWLLCILGYILTASYWRREKDETRRNNVVNSVNVRSRTVYEVNPVAHPFFLSTLTISFAFLGAWLFLFQAENIVGAAAVLWVVTFFVFVAGIFNYVTLYEVGNDLFLRSPREVWLNRILVQNGVELFGTWILICAYINTLQAIEFPPQGAMGVEGHVAAKVAISLLLFGFLLWYPLEITIFDKYCRYGMLQYAVAAFAMGGIYARRESMNDVPLERLVLSFMIIAILMFVFKVALVIYRENKKPLFPDAAPPLDSSQR